MSKIEKGEYSAKDIDVLEGLDAVRLRPGMYIGTTGSKGMHHLLWEIVDNSIDEVTNGFGDTIEIEIYPDNSISVKDNGRGIPTDIHPKYKVPAVELVFTKLHAGGKFNNKNYSFSGGLHGVGASVANALSLWLNVEIYRNGTCYREEFHSPEIVDENGVTKIVSGAIKTPLTTSECDKKFKGTKVTFLPDSRMFLNEKFDFDTIDKKIKDLAFLNGGMKISVSDYRVLTETGRPKSKSYCFKGGLVDFVKYLNESKGAIYPEPIYVEKKQDKFYVSVAFQHTDCYTESTYSYVNNIPTSEGGTHETGFRSALTKAFIDFGKQKNIIKEKDKDKAKGKDDSFIGEDFREGMTAVLSVKMQNVEFEGQTKTKLGNPEAKVLVDSLLTDAIKDALNKLKRETIDSIYAKAEIARKTRLSVSKAKDVSRGINAINKLSLVGKFANCSGRNPKFNELFIVEGDSAGGSAKQGRDRQFQAVLPLKGKPLNAEKKKVEEIIKNEEIASLIRALGTNFDSKFDLNTLNFNKVIILADADQDGAHIRAILLTFFFRHMKDLITDGHVFIGMPPLYKVASKDKVQYAYDDEELKTMIANAGRNYTLQRYKGLGEMNPEQLWDTTLDPEHRTLMKVTIEDAAEADRLISTLMGTDVEIRRNYIYEYANFNKSDNFKELRGN